MPRIKLTETAIEKLKAPDPSAKQVLHWDARSARLWDAVFRQHECTDLRCSARST